MSSKPMSHILIGLAFVLILWVSTYAALSRRGYAEADRENSEGFYYFTPSHADSWRTTEAICTYVFWPLISSIAPLAWDGNTALSHSGI